MPLPKPKPGETLAEFLEYCPWDTQMMLEYQEVDQRFAVCRSLYDQANKTQKATRLTYQKINRQEYLRSWDKLTKKAERQQYQKWFNYFKAENFKGADEFLKTGQTSGFDNLFTETDITNLYIELFTEVGTMVSIWYQDNYRDFIKKDLTASLWRNTYASFGAAFAADKVTLVSGNRKKELQAVLQRLMTDADFQSLNERQAQRVLRSQFVGYSKTQAERLVRTEAITAANYASTQTADNIFGADGYQKEWITALDGRERPAHRAADGQTVGAKEPFEVGGELLAYPGDPNASAKNRINCRCSFLTLPLGAAEEIENNLTGGLVSDIGFSIAGSLIEFE